MSLHPSSSHATTPAAAGRIVSWLGIATLVAAGCLILALAWSKLGDLDTGYHVAYGGHFLDHGRIVERDPFLYRENAVPFINANWGGQVVLALTHRLGGANGLIALRTVLLAIVFASIAVVVRRTAETGKLSTPSIQNSAPSHWTAWAWILAALAGYERFSMRPELFSYVAMTGMLVVLVRGVHSWRSLCALGVLQVAWVNLHSYFLVGILLTASWLAGEVVRLLCTWRRQGLSPESIRPVRWLALALLVQVVACLVNPWHIHGAIFPIKTLQFLRAQAVMGGAGGEASGSAWSEISEFKSPFSFGGLIINARTLHAYYVLLAVAGIGLILLAVRKQIGPAIAIAVFLLMSTQMRRNIAQFAFVASPLAIGILAAQVTAFNDKMSYAVGRRHVKSCLLVGTIVLAVWWVHDLWTGHFYYVERRISRELGQGYHQVTFPKAAVQWLAQQNQLQPRLFVDYFSSSNTLLWLPERFKLFVDTNTFAASDETLRLAFDVGLSKAPHNEVFDRYGVNVVLLHCGPDTQNLVRNLVRDDGQWALVYFDPTAVIFVRRIQGHVPVILANQITPDVIARTTASWISSSDHSGPYYRALFFGTTVNVPMSLGWWEQAAQLAECALDQAPDYFEAENYRGVCRGNLGNAAFKAGDYSRAKKEWINALASFEQVLRLQPDHQEAAKFLDATRQRLAVLQELQRVPSGEQR